MEVYELFLLVGNVVLSNQYGVCQPKLMRIIDIERYIFSRIIAKMAIPSDKYQKNWKSRLREN